MKSYPKVAIWILGSLFAFCILWGAWVNVHYVSVMPRSPDVETGRVHEIVVEHGKLVYVTQQELDRANFVTGPVFWVGIGALAGALFLVGRQRNLSR